MFKKVYFEISNVCNLSCPFCPIVKREPCFVGEADFEKVLREATNLTDRMALHVVGEPLLHPDFSRFIRLGETLGSRFEITSNGTLLEGKEDILFSSSVVQVNFSLHALLANEVENLPRKIEVILGFAREAKKRRPDLYINFRFWDLEKEVTSPKNGILKKLEAEYGFQMQDVDVKRKKSFRLSGKTYLHFDTEFRWPSMEDPELGKSGFCYGLKSQVAILSNGIVTSCCLDAEGAIDLGNAFTRAFSEIIGSRRAMAIRQGFEKRSLTEALCRRCSYIQRFSP